MPTERGWYKFYVKEGTQGPFLATEATGDALPSLKGMLCFDLKPGMNYDQAQEIADSLNHHIASFALVGETTAEQPIGNSAPPQDDHE
jgi:hypothetical protein